MTQVTAAPPTEQRTRRPSRRTKVALIAGAVVFPVVIATVAIIAGCQFFKKAPVVLSFTGLNEAYGVAVDGAGNVYVTDKGNSRVLKLPAGATSQTELPFTGLRSPDAVAVDGAGNVYVADSGNNRVLKLPMGATSPTELPFTGLSFPIGVAVDGAGNLYVADHNNKRVVKLAVGSSTQTVLGFTDLRSPDAVAVDGAGNIYVVDTPIPPPNARLLKLPAGSTVQTELSPPPQASTQCPGTSAVAVDTAGTVYVLCGDYRVWKLPTGSGTWTVLSFKDLGLFPGLAVDTAGNLYTTRGTQVLKLPAG